jgi:hypothetical protein
VCRSFIRAGRPGGGGKVLKPCRPATNLRHVNPGVSRSGLGAGRVIGERLISSTPRRPSIPDPGPKKRKLRGRVTLTPRPRPSSGRGPDVHNSTGRAVDHNSRGQARCADQLLVSAVAAAEREPQRTVRLGLTAGYLVAVGTVRPHERRAVAAALLGLHQCPMTLPPQQLRMPCSACRHR